MLSPVPEATQPKESTMKMSTLSPARAQEALAKKAVAPSLADVNLSPVLGARMPAVTEASAAINFAQAR